MSEPGWVQLTSPVPDASDCSASNPSAILPVAATAVPPSPGVVTVVTAPGVDTVTGCVPLVFAAADVAALPAAEVWPADGALPLPAAGAATTALNVAAPADVAAPELAAAACDGSATIEIRAVAEPGADGGQDLVIDVTA